MRWLILAVQLEAEPAHSERRRSLYAMLGLSSGAHGRADISCCIGTEDGPTLRCENISY